MIGVPYREPKTPPFEMVKVPKIENHKKKHLSRAISVITSGHFLNRKSLIFGLFAIHRNCLFDILNEALDEMNTAIEIK